MAEEIATDDDDREGGEGASHNRRLVSEEDVRYAKAVRCGIAARSLRWPSLVLPSAPSDSSDRVSLSSGQDTWLGLTFPREYKPTSHCARLTMHLCSLDEAYQSRACSAQV